MTAAKKSGTASQPLLSVTEPQSPPEYVVVLPTYPPPHRHRLLRKSCKRCLFCVACSLVLLVAAGYILWPYTPELSIVSLRLDRVNFDTWPAVSLNLTMALEVKVWNSAVYPVDYDSLVVAIGYRGEGIGYAASDGGVIEARQSSLVNATLQLDQVEILRDVVLLLEDLEKGAVTFDTESEMKGKLGIWTMFLPLKTETECEVVVNTRNGTIAHQSCYSEATEI